MPFGKYCGEVLVDIAVENPGYLEWFAENGDESALKICIETFLEGL